MSIRIITGDCVEQMRALPENSIDAIVTDPPYGLSFMGKSWDFEVPTGPWASEALRVLKPGGHLLAFGGTRTYHRLAAGLEDAGFEIRDSIHWVYGSGFPKSLNLDGGLGTALKPAHEPIVLARKALSGTVAATVAKYGTGALNVDASRVEGAKAGGSGGAPLQMGGANHRPFHDANVPREFDTTLGRWPPNFVLSHAPECVEGGKCAEDCAVAEMDRQSGESAAKAERLGLRGGSAWHGQKGFGSPDATGRWPADQGGGASRFFPVFRYEAKPSRAEREAGLREAGHQLGEKWDRASVSKALEGMGSLTKPMRNTHPTVKPVALMAWLIELVTPKGGTVLDPFLGSGTTAIAAQRVGRNCIGIEREAEYVAIAEARIRGDSPMFSKVEVL